MNTNLDPPTDDESGKITDNAVFKYDIQNILDDYEKEKKVKKKDFSSVDSIVLEKTNNHNSKKEQVGHVGKKCCFLFIRTKNCFMSISSIIILSFISAFLFCSAGILVIAYFFSANSVLSAASKRDISLCQQVKIFVVNHFKETGHVVKSFASFLENDHLSNKVYMHNITNEVYSFDVLFPSMMSFLYGVWDRTQFQGTNGYGLIFISNTGSMMLSCVNCDSNLWSTKYGAMRTSEMYASTKSYDYFLEEKRLFYFGFEQPSFTPQMFQYYQETAESAYGEMVWTHVQDTKKISNFIPSMKAVNSDGQFIGVVGLYQPEREISMKIGEMMNFTETGVQIFLFEKETKAYIATNLDNPKQDESTDGSVTLDNSPDPLAKIIGLKVFEITKFEDDTLFPLTVVDEKGMYIVSSVVFSVSGLDLVLVVATPFISVFGQTISNLITSIFVNAGFLFGFGILAYIILFTISNQLKVLTKKLKNVESMQLENIELNSCSFVTEIVDLNQSFAFMIDKLIEYRSFLPRTLLDLNHEVVKKEKEENAKTGIYIRDEESTFDGKNDKNSSDSNDKSETEEGSNESSCVKSNKNSSSSDTTFSEIVIHSSKKKNFDLRLKEKNRFIIVINFVGLDNLFMQSKDAFSTICSGIFECIEKRAKNKGYIHTYNMKHFVLSFKDRLKCSRFTGKVFQDLWEIIKDKDSVKFSIIVGEGKCWIGNIGSKRMRLSTITGDYVELLKTVNRRKVNGRSRWLITDEIESFTRGLTLRPFDFVDYRKNKKFVFAVESFRKDVSIKNKEMRFDLLMSVVHFFRDEYYKDSIVSIKQYLRKYPTDLEASQLGAKLIFYLNKN